MALTNAQKVDVRRWIGYGMIADGNIIDTSDFAYGMRSPAVITTLVHRLNTMQTEEEAVLTSVYLTPLTVMEAAIPGIGANLDTDEAAVWKHNKNELNDRRALFNSVRRDLCGFLGFPPGPYLTSSNSVSLSRA